MVLVRRSLRNRIVATLLLVAGLALLATSVQAPPADASSQGCTYTNFPDKYVCFNINGRGTRVDSFVVIRGKPSKDNGICNYDGRVRVTAPDGRTWNYTSAYRSGCQVVRASRTIIINQDFPSGSRACGSFYENGQLQSTACNKIRS